MNHDRVLFVYFEAGAGHRVVAEAVADAILRNPLNRYRVQLLDFFRETGLSGIESITKDLYNNFLLQHPFLYSLYYRLGNSPPVIRFLYRLFINERFWQSIDGIIDRHDPRMCVLVNPHLSECFYRVTSKRGRAPVLVNLVSDPFSIHSLWLSSNADYNILFSQEAGRIFIRNGIPESKIKTFDYPVCVKFADCTHTRSEILAKHRFSPEKLTILICAGRHKVRLVREIVDRVIGQELPVQMFVVLGEKDERRWALLDVGGRDASSVRVIGYTDKMDELMTASDIVACKAGPAMLFEAINMKKPMVILSYVPGQEKGNLDFVLNENFGWYTGTSDGFLNLLRRVLDDRSLLEEKIEALERRNISNGAPHVAQFLIDLLSE